MGPQNVDDPRSHNRLELEGQISYSPEGGLQLIHGDFLQLRGTHYLRLDGDTHFRIWLPPSENQATSLLLADPVPADSHCKAV